MWYTHIVSSHRDNNLSGDSAAIHAALTAFGLSPEESKVYLALLSMGTQPASVIAKQADLKRGHTYNLLTRLKGRGIVQEHQKRGVTFFTGSPPEALLSLLERRSEELAVQKRGLLDVIPLLKSLGSPLAVPPKVRLFQGVDGIKEIYNDTVRYAEGIIYAVGDFAHFFPKERSVELNDWIWRYCDRRAKKGIWYHGIVNKSPDSDLAFQKRREQKRKLKMLTGIELSVEVNIYGDHVALISSSCDMVGLIIEDRPIAETLRNFHQAVWGMLPEYR